MTSHTPPNDDPVAVLRWAHARFGDGLVVTASFGDPTLAHLAGTTIPDVDIVLLDTGYLFAETDWYADDLRRRYGLNLRTVHPLPDTERDVWRSDTNACCAARKVEPLNRALRNKSAWITGLRRSDSAARAQTPVVHEDPSRGIIKVNPLATWNDDDVAAYVAAHDLPAHPLADRGYRSIGCWPCTAPVGEGEDARAGRWAGEAKTECGLHLSGDATAGTLVTVASSGGGRSDGGRSEVAR
ncbi:MAG: phosphoadenylyl-sulfate reductase [Microthrixaceae bacterium]|nr:phosphoadenylyl-sulfate reductase [Microthrixaceae bacterium]